MKDNFGLFLENLLDKKNISQRDFAKKIGVSETTISRYIHNIQFPRSDVITKMSNILEVSTDYLLGNEKDKLTPTQSKEMFKQFLVDNDVIKDKNDPTDEEIKMFCNMFKAFMDSRNK